MGSSDHIAPLNAIADRIRATGRDVSGTFCEKDGGTKARFLFLFSDPGPHVKESKRISEDNQDPSARCIKSAREDSDIARVEKVAWNIVPWWVDGNVKASDLAAAAPWTVEVIQALPRLEAVILFGNNAILGWKHVDPLLEGLAPRIHMAPHPASQSMNQSGSNERLMSVLTRVRRLYPT